MLANPVRGQVEIEIGGTAKMLHITYEVIYNFEEMTGKNFFETVQKLSASDISKILFHGLKHCDPNLSIKKVLSWQEDQPLNYWIEKIGQGVVKWQSHQKPSGDDFLPQAQPSAAGQVG